MKNASDLFEVPHFNLDIKELSFDKNIIEDQYRTVDKDNEEPHGAYDKKRLELCLGKDWLIGLGAT